MKKKISFPVMKVRLVPSEKVIANDYNPNKVSIKEMKLLIHSIEEDGLTQPIVVICDTSIDKYIVVDGFHRYIVLKDHFNCANIPVVVIEKDIKNRMASTIRHNRARGKHQVELQSALVLSLLKLGWNDYEIACHLGMTAEEILRLKQSEGVAEKLRNREYAKAWIIEQ